MKNKLYNWHEIQNLKNKFHNLIAAFKNKIYNWIKGGDSMAKRKRTWNYGEGIERTASRSLCIV